LCRWRYHRPFRFRNGVPPATVTASLKVTVNVTTFPAFRLPEPAVIPVPEAVTKDTVGPVVSICSTPAGFVITPDIVASFPAASLSVRAVRIECRHGKIGRVLAGKNRIAEVQGVAG